MQNTWPVIFELSVYIRCLTLDGIQGSHLDHITLRDCNLVNRAYYDQNMYEAHTCIASHVLPFSLPHDIWPCMTFKYEMQGIDSAEKVVRYCFQSVCVSVCVCPANILAFYFSAISRDIDLKFIQNTYRAVFNSLTNWHSKVNVTWTVYCFLKV